MVKIKSNKVLISLPDSYLTEVDNYSKEKSLSRSDIVRRALEEYFKKVKPQNANNT